MTSLDQSTEYRIKVLGSIDANIVDWWGPLASKTTIEDNGTSVTTLSGIITDQAGIVGFIRRLHGIGLILLSVERLESATTSEGTD